MEDIKIIDIKSEKLDFEYKLDTWGNAKNYDKLITNIVRVCALGLLAFSYKLTGTFWWYIIYTLGIYFVGVTDIIFFRHDKKTIEIRCW